MIKIIEHCVDQIMRANPDADAMTISKIFETVIRDGIRKKKINIGIPYQLLTGNFLEWTIYELFETMGVKVQESDDKTHDGIIHYKTDKKILKFVLEIKSHLKGGVELSELRQLDDWVYRVSGEEMARKATNIQYDVRWFNGQPVLQTKDLRHPNPHKGLLIINHDFKNDPNDRCNPLDRTRLILQKQEIFV